MSKTYVILNSKGQFLGKSIWKEKWVNEYPDARVFTLEQDVRDMHRDIRFTSKMVVNYGTVDECELI